MLETGPRRKARFVAIDARNVPDMFRKRSEASASLPALYAKEGGPDWVKHTWKQFFDRARQVGKGLLGLGLERGDRIAILGPTQKPWAFYDMGSQLAGLVSFGIYPKQAVEQIRYIVDHSDAKAVIVDDPTEIENVIAACAGLDKVQAIIPWKQADYEATKDKDPRITSPEKLAGDALTDEEVDAVIQTVKPEDVAILVYTSGTTGPPKGAMITHANILAILGRQKQFLEVWEDDSSLSFLPMAHAAERVLGFYGRINAGFATAYASSIGVVLDELKEVQPTVFGSVPRIFEKAYGKIQGEIEKKSGTVQKLFNWAVKVGKARTKAIIEGRPIPFGVRFKYKIASALVFKKIRAAFGGRVRMFITGAAPTAIEILEFFWAADLPIYEAYGMTESTVITHVNHPGSTKLGTVGRVIEPMECRIADDGEVLVKGPLVFKGYFKNPEATAETIIDGWLHTGDIGKIDKDGFLRITDRKKHLIITAGGKNLTPANIENAIKNQSPLIHQVHAHGDKRPYISAIVAPSPIETLEFGVERGLVTQKELAQRTAELLDNPSGRTEALNQATAKVVVHDEFRQRILDAVRKGNTALANVEKVKRFYILERDFSQEAGELTPTMKLKRKEVENKYSAILEKIYTEDGFAQNV